MADQSTSQPSELQQALEQAAGPLDDYLEPDIHAADYGPEDSEAVEPKEFPPPPTGPELTGFVADLNGATDWPDPPPQPGTDTPWDMRPIRADQLQAGDILHYADHAVTVVEVSHPVVPLVCRRDDLTVLFGLTPGASALVLASRPSGWDDRAKADVEQPAEQQHEPCPDCGDDPGDGELHRDGCPRVGTAGQFGPPWRPGPWGPLSDLTKASGEDQGTGPGEPA